MNSRAIQFSSSILVPHTVNGPLCNYQTFAECSWMRPNLVLNEAKRSLHGPNHDLRQDKCNLKLSACWACGQLQEPDGWGARHHHPGHPGRLVILVILVILIILLIFFIIRWSTFRRTSLATGQLWSRFFQLSIVTIAKIATYLIFVAFPPQAKLWLNISLALPQCTIVAILSPLATFLTRVDHSSRLRLQRASWWRPGGRASRTGTTSRTSFKMPRWLIPKNISSNIQIQIFKIFLQNAEVTDP